MSDCTCPSYWQQDPSCPDHRKPKRIQRKRTKGWRMPEGAVYVGRPTKWGNPFRVTPGKNGGTSYGPGWCDGQPDCAYITSGGPGARASLIAHVVELYELHIQHCDWRRFNRADVVAKLRGRDLACWCPLDQPCHADVLLKIANSGGSDG